MKFSEDVHRSCKNLWQKSFDHPFIKEMAKGTLATEKFKFYCMQDYKYLESFSDLYLKLSEKMKDKSESDFLKNIARKDAESEIIERKNFFQKMHVSLDEYLNTPMAPTTYNYVNHMTMSMHENPVVGLASLVPCPWLYCELAKYWRGTTSSKEIYNDFFKMYNDDSFIDETQQIIDFMDKLAQRSDEKTRKLMKRAFIRSSYYESQFWQMAYQEQGWQ